MKARDAIDYEQFKKQHDKQWNAQMRRLNRAGGFENKLRDLYRVTTDSSLPGDAARVSIVAHTKHVRDENIPELRKRLGRKSVPIGSLVINRDSIVLTLTDGEHSFTENPQTTKEALNLVSAYIDAHYPELRR